MYAILRRTDAGSENIILAVGQHARPDTISRDKAQHIIIDTHNYQTDDPAILCPPLAMFAVKGDKTVVYAVN